MKAITILGSTGSIGMNTLDVITRSHDYRVFALTANTGVKTMLEQCLQFAPDYAVMADPGSAAQLQTALTEQASATQVLAGEDSLAFVAGHDQVDTVMAAIVGAAGLVPTLTAVRASKKVLLANKEALIMAGELFIAELAANQAVMLPIDSEHNAIFQCLPPESRLIGSDVLASGVRRILLTASGGPFRETPLAALPAVTPAQACLHPNWSMGRKISVDSATMMNKGLELIEACFLFGVSPQQIEVLIHPQSIVHSMVEYRDGSLLAQMGTPDMRIPIAYGLAWPQRMESGAEQLDLTKMQNLQFQHPDLERFPCLALGMQAAATGGTMPAILNAANEMAVAAFLEEQISFTDIPVIIAATMSQMTCGRAESLAIIRDADSQARTLAAAYIAETMSQGSAG
ncbi:MAG: 1-deoxy-D-xylulose-5-phosphate reductoisomerase [Pseudomonadales bacterium]|nr:1-deoxy-D-xylulose-5-phosphate reductoisomerase [Pseudomonadales bacterium]